ncbi:MAG TPA: hypothetical protein VER03_01855 [Bryobacteraceae bacterium]|nr:hypothetical protein [Bryobacteraceae bacterium]
MEREDLENVNPIGRMDTLVIRTLGMLTSAAESAAQVPAGTFANLVNPHIERFARKHFRPEEGRSE